MFNAGSEFTFINRQKSGNTLKQPTNSSEDSNQHYRSLKQKIPGSNHGLRLVINAETYKYTENVEPNGYDEAGIRIQVHSTYEPPSVEQLGVGVPTGTKAFLAISKTESENMEPPWGACNKTWEDDRTYGFRFLKYSGIFKFFLSFFCISDTASFLTASNQYFKARSFIFTIIA